MGISRSRKWSPLALPTCPHENLACETLRGEPTWTLTSEPWAATFVRAGRGANGKSSSSSSLCVTVPEK